MRVEVESYSGFKADERPLRFRLGDRDYQVVELLDKWYGPSETWFKVTASDGGLYIFKLSADGVWTLSSFRATPSQQEQEQQTPNEKHRLSGSEL
jgi:hypothetical protein